MRNRVKAIFSNSNPGELVQAVCQHMTKAPSQTTLVLFAIFTGPNVPAPLAECRPLAERTRLWRTVDHVAERDR